MISKKDIKDLNRYFIEETCRLERRIKQLEEEVEDWKHRKECADDFIEDIKHTIIDPDYKPVKDYGNLRGLAIFAGIRRLHELAGINLKRKKHRS